MFSIEREELMMQELLRKILGAKSMIRLEGMGYKA